MVEKQIESHPVCANHELQLPVSGLPDLEKVAVVPVKLILLETGPWKDLLQFIDKSDLVTYLTWRVEDFKSNSIS